MTSLNTLQSVIRNVKVESRFVLNFYSILYYCHFDSRYPILNITIDHPLHTVISCIYNIRSFYITDRITQYSRRILRMRVTRAIKRTYSLKEFISFVLSKQDCVRNVAGVCVSSNILD